MENFPFYNLSVTSTFQNFWSIVYTQNLEKKKKKEKIINSAKNSSKLRNNEKFSYL